MNQLDIKIPESRGAKENRSSLDSLFAPKSVAVIGATDREGTVGRTVLKNLLGGKFCGSVYAINPKRAEVLGLRTYAKIGEVPEKVDLAVVVTPAGTVPELIGECVDAGVSAAIVISAGFREHGAEGAALEAKIQEQLRRGTMRMIGPNCLGVMNPWLAMNATFAHDIARPGSVAFLSQSGALLTAILDWSFQEQVGFSAIVSTGSMLDVGWGDLIDFFANDPATESILLYMESPGDARSFLSAAREVALRKPIIVIKAGRTAEASKAAGSHTGALTGSDEVFDAAMRRCGVLRVSSIADLFYMAGVLGKQPRPRGPKLSILTNAGGPAVLATDALLASGGELAPLSDSTTEALNKLLPPHWSHGNPIDILGDADPERYTKALEIAAADPNSDGLLVILTPQGMTDPEMVAQRLKEHAKIPGKPVLASWMGGETVAKGISTLNAHGIPSFSFPDTAARVFSYMWKFTYNLRGIYETPLPSDDLASMEKVQTQVKSLVQGIRAAGRTILTEAESKHVMALYGIPTVETRIAASESEAAACAYAIGFPVVLKINSETITHKSDVGGVQLDLHDERSVREAFRAIEGAIREKFGAQHFNGVTVQPMVKQDGYELIIGSSVDAQFGPVILFGSGGQLVEVYRDRALALPPLNTTLALRLMEQTRIFLALRGVRGRAPVDVPALENVLVRFSRLVIEQPWIKEMDINPLLVSSERIIALDARILLHDPATPEGELPRPAIRPYPAQYVSPWTAKSGLQILLRPIRPEDEPAMIKFHETLSERSVYQRYFHMEKLSTRIAHERLTRNCFIDYDREMALVADWENPDGQHEIIGVGRLIQLRNSGNSELAIIVADKFQSIGIGSELMGRLIQVARDEKLNRITVTILTDNTGMRGVATRYGFKAQQGTDADIVRAVLNL
jgi:acetyltransferase